MQCKCNQNNERKITVERKKPRAQCKEYKGDKEAGPARKVNNGFYYYLPFRSTVPVSDNDRSINGWR